MTLLSHIHTSPRHTTHYLECGPADGPLLIFLHGWPEIGLVWRAQLEAFAAEGWHCVAPDMRGYGGSSAPAANDAYALREIVADMVELHDHLDRGAICTIGGNRQGDPMRAACADLSVARLPAGHWLPLERKAELVEVVRDWLQAKRLDRPA